MAWRRGWIALAVCLLLLTTTSIARAAPVVVVVRVSAPADDTLLRRVLGQTSDLPLQIVRVEGATDPPGARAIVSFDIADSGEITVVVAVPEAKRRLVAHVGRDAGSESAMFESASLIVRDALQSVLDGRPIGEPIESATASPPPAAVAARPTPKRPAVVRVPRSPKWLPFTAIGARVVFSSATPSYATTYRLGLARSHVEFGAAMTLGATDVESDALAALRIRRHAFGAFGGWSTKVGEQLSAAAAVHAGAVMFVRATSPTIPELRASATEPNVHPFVGPEARITWQPAVSWLRVAFAVGADVVISAPTFSYEGSNRTLALWAIQPYFTALLELGARK